MINTMYSCEHKCSSSEIRIPTQLIVITGGPGAGKTAVLEFLRKILCDHVAILPEAASILFNGGFWRLKSPTAKVATQKAIYYVQEQMQSLVINEKKWSIGLCDRGTLDGAAYWPESQQSFFKELNTDIEKEYSKYMAIIHLNSPSLSNGYNYENPVRTETAEEALIIDQKIHETWKNHPNYNRIESTNDFIDKIHKTALLIYSFLPDHCKKHLKGVSE